RGWKGRGSRPFLADVEGERGPRVHAVARGGLLAQDDPGRDARVDAVADVAHLEAGETQRVEGLAGLAADEVGHEVLAPERAPADEQRGPLLAEGLRLPRGRVLHQDRSFFRRIV